MPIVNDDDDILDEDEDEEDDESDGESAITNTQDHIASIYDRFISNEQIRDSLRGLQIPGDIATPIDLDSRRPIRTTNTPPGMAFTPDYPEDEANPSNPAWVDLMIPDANREVARFNIAPNQSVIYDAHTGQIVRARGLDPNSRLFNEVRRLVDQRVLRGNGGAGPSIISRSFRVQPSTGRLNDPTPLDQIPAELIEGRANAEYDRRQDMGYERDFEMFDRIREHQRMRFIDKINEINNYLPPKDQINQMCNLCFRGINERLADSFMAADEMVVCARCYGNRFRPCTECEKQTYSIDMVTRTDGERLCVKCAQEKYAECPGCDEFDLVTNFVKHDGQKVCAHCIEQINNEDNPMPSSANAGSILTRNYTSRKSAKFCSPDEGSIVKSKRMFSAEIECMYPTVQIANCLLDDQPRGLGVTYDGSISTHGVELQTPKLQGSTGEKFLKQLCDKLSDSKFDTDKTCGLHIHLDGREFVPHRGGPTSRFDGDDLRNLFMFYMVFEDVIMSFLPRSRRSNRYCKQLKREYHLAEIMNSRNLEELEMIWYRVDTPYEKDNSKSQDKHDTRYAGVNFHTLLSESHIEIRYHSGTTRAIKILEWINLHCMILDRIAGGYITRPNIIDAQEETDMDLKTELFFELVNLPVRARRYFISRQTKFKTKERVEEKELITA